MHCWDYTFPCIYMYMYVHHNGCTYRNFRGGLISRLSWASLHVHSRNKNHENLSATGLRTRHATYSWKLKPQICCWSSTFTNHDPVKISTYAVHVQDLGARGTYYEHSWKILCTQVCMCTTGHELWHITLHFHIHTCTLLQRKLHNTKPHRHPCVHVVTRKSTHTPWLAHPSMLSGHTNTTL